jgi:UDP:flavonoid glycosyltransferase YjiC (YdhE family)
MDKRYQVRAIFADEFKPFAEIVGLYYSQQQAEDAKEAFEDQEDAPNFMACEILYLVDALE